MSRKTTFLVAMAIAAIISASISTPIFLQKPLTVEVATRSISLYGTQKITIKSRGYAGEVILTVKNLPFNKTVMEESVAVEVGQEMSLNLTIDEKSGMGLYAVEAKSPSSKVLDTAYFSVSWAMLNLTVDMPESITVGLEDVNLTIPIRVNVYVITNDQLIPLRNATVKVDCSDGGFYTYPTQLTLENGTVEFIWKPPLGNKTVVFQILAAKGGFKAAESTRLMQVITFNQTAMTEEVRGDGGP